MPVVTIKIANKTYDLSCDEGEQAKLQKLAERVGKRVDATAGGLGIASEGLALAIVALQMEDELESLNNKVNLRSNEGFVSDESEAVKKAIKLLTPIVVSIETLAKELEQV